MRRYWDVVAGGFLVALVGGEVYALATGRELFSDYGRARLRAAQRVAGERYPCPLKNRRVLVFWGVLGWFSVHCPLDCWSFLNLWRRWRKRGVA